jgi:hypothetical protein
VAAPDTITPAAPDLRAPTRRRSLKRAVGIILLALAVLLAVRIGSVFFSFRDLPIGYSRSKTRLHLTEGYYDYRGVIHCHSHLSHDSDGTFEQIAEAARRVDLDFVVMTDHIAPGVVERGREEAQRFNESGQRPLFIIGAEIGPMNNAVLAFPLKGYVADRHDGVERIVAAACAQGAAAFIDHAERFRSWDVADAGSLDGVEIYNLHANIKDADRRATILRGLLLSPGPMLRRTIECPPTNLQKWDTLLARQRAPVVSGGDAHAQYWSQLLAGGVVGLYERVFKITTTHVLVRELDEASVMDALRRGRSFVAFDIWRDATGFAFTATDGATKWWMGDDVPWSEALTLRVTVPYYGTIMLVKDGKTVATQHTNTFQFKPPGPGVYRVEVFFKDKLGILSNPIYVR